MVSLFGLFTLHQDMQMTKREGMVFKYGMMVVFLWLKWPSGIDLIFTKGPKRPWFQLDKHPARVLLLNGKQVDTVPPRKFLQQ